MSNNIIFKCQSQLEIFIIWKVTHNFPKRKERDERASIDRKTLYISLNKQRKSQINCASEPDDSRTRLTSAMARLQC